MAAAGPFGPQWFGLNVGQPTQAVIDRLGDPLLLDDNEPERGGVTLLYAFDEGRTQALFTTLYGHIWIVQFRPDSARYGVVPIRGGVDSAFRDPFGVALADPVNRIVQLRGEPPRSTDDFHGLRDHVYDDGTIIWTYNAFAGEVMSIEERLRPKPIDALPRQPEPPFRHGTSFEDALIIAGESARFTPGAYEKFYVERLYRPCAPGERIERRHLVYDGQTAMMHAGVNYTVVSAHCSRGGTKSELYFRRR